MQRKLIGMMPLMIALLASCSPLPPARPFDAQQLNAKIPARLTGDPELQSAVLRVSPVVAEGRGFQAVITISGKEWSDRSRSQQDRLLQKIGAHMQSELRAVQSGPPYNTFSAQLVNDLGRL